MPPKNNLVTVKASQAKLKKWRSRIDLAREERQRHESDWDLMIEAYKASVKKAGAPEDLKTNIIFRNVEQKKSLLFFRSPKMKLTPTEMAKAPVATGQVDPNTGQPVQATIDPAVVIHEQVLNHHMSENGINLPLLMDLVLFDCLCPSGLMVSKIGYRPYIKMVKEPVMQPVMDELGGPMVDELGEPMQQPVIDERGRPVMEDVPVLVHEEYFWSRVSPKRALIPADFYSTDYEKAPWLGVDFEMSLRDAKRLYNLPKDFKPGKGPQDDRLLGKNRAATEQREDVVTGTEIFYKAYLEFDDVVHPEVYYQLVLIDGHREGNVPVAAVHRLCPYQELNPETEQLTTDSMRGNPIHIGSIRDLSDSAYPQSDSQMIHAQVKEVDTYRRQNIKLRDANLTKFAYDTEKLTPEALTAIKSGDVGQFVPLVSGALQGGADKVIAPIAKATGNRVDTQTAFLLEQDIEKALAMGANQLGVETDTTRTATELSMIQSNSNVRMEKEQNRVLDYVIRGIRKYDALLQRFADEDELIEIVGEAGLQGLQVWNKDVIAGKFLYDIKPDSQLRVDAATERNLHMQFYNLTAQDPFNNRVESLKALQRLFNIDPAKAIQQPPEDKPEPNVGIAFKGEDLISPASPIVIEILEQGGITISEENKLLAGSLAIRARMDQVTQEAGELTGGTAHGGPAERIQPIDKSQEDHTGSLSGPNVGGNAP